MNIYGKRSIFIASIVILVLVFSLGVCLAQEKTYTLRFNTVAGPNEPQTIAMGKFGEVVENLSGGKITVKVFHSGQLGDQKTGILGIMKGSLEMSSDSSALWFADLANFPEIGVLEVAYLYRDLDHMYRVLLGPTGQKFWEDLAKRSGIRVLDVWYLGTRQLNLTKKAGVVRRPEDLKGIKLRMPNVEAWLDVGRALGANPTPLGFGEVYMALKTGTIDGQDNPLPTDYSAKFYEVTRYIVLTDHMLGYITPIINEKLWQEMPDKYRVYIKHAIQVARFNMNQIVLEQEATLLGKFQKEFGMEVVIPDKKAFMESARKFYSQEKFNKRWGKGMYAKIQTLP
ncbi:MAG: DctP family TRAP transporter solute-binding subunit [Proteobacteria bacterium]|nr:DctP family TRAP transporter solute-binding subunit [Pseudomonadota bacterium]